jgi:hypothetical protein
MTNNEAHHLLNKRKQGLAVPQYLVNRALVVSGDLGMACSPCQAARVESTGMAQGEGTGVMPDSLMEWNKNRFDEPHESPI